VLERLVPGAFPGRRRWRDGCASEARSKKCAAGAMAAGVTALRQARAEARAMLGA